MGGKKKSEVHGYNGHNCHIYPTDWMIKAQEERRRMTKTHFKHVKINSDYKNEVWPGFGIPSMVESNIGELWDTPTSNSKEKKHNTMNLAKNSSCIIQDCQNTMQLKNPTPKPSYEVWPSCVTYPSVCSPTAAAEFPTNSRKTNGGTEYAGKSYVKDNDLISGNADESSFLLRMKNPSISLIWKN